MYFLSVFFPPTNVIVMLPVHGQFGFIYIPSFETHHIIMRTFSLKMARKWKKQGKLKDAKCVECHVVSLSFKYNTFI